MKRIIVGIAAAAALAVVPGVASAHSGAVTCTEQGVTFSYNADFPIDTVVNEDVNGVVKQYTVKAHVASMDIIPATSDHILARSTWLGGGTIAATDLVCPSFTPPVCIGETVTRTVYTPGDPVVQYVQVPVDVPGPTIYVDRFVVKTKVKYKTRWKVVYKFIKYKPVHQPKRSIPGGTLG